MTQSRYVLISVALVAGISLAGLLCTPPEYPIWIAYRHLPHSWAEWLHLKSISPDHQSHFNFWAPILILLTATLSPAAPSFRRLSSLGRNRAWVLLGLLPWLNILFFAILTLSTGKTQQTPKLRIPELMAIVALFLIAILCYYYLLIYPYWLAARS